MQKSHIRYVPFLIPIIIMMFVKNHAYYWDGVDSAWLIENLPTKNLFHPHHLIYMPFNQAILTVVRAVGINIQSIDLLVLVNIIFGIAFLSLSFQIFRQFFPRWQMGAFVAVLIIGCSYTFGAFSRNADPYMIPTTIIAFVVYRIIRNYPETNYFKVSIFDWIFVLIAALFHQISLLFIPALFYAQIQSPKSNRSWIMRLSLLYFSIAYVAVYVLVFLVTKPELTFSAFRQWVIGYAGRDFWVFSETKQFLPALTQSVYEGLVSNKALFIAPVNREALRLWEYRFFVLFDHEEAFGFYGGWIVFLAALVLIISGILMLYHQPENRRLLIFLIIYILPFILLFQFFTPYNFFYRLFYLLPLAILLMKGVSRYWDAGKITISGVKVFKITAVLLLAVYLTINFAFGFLPERRKYNNPLLRYAHEISEKTSDEALFIFNGHPDVYFKYRVYLRYFADRDVFLIWQYSTNDIRRTNIERINKKATITYRWLRENFNTIYIVDQDDIEYSSIYLIIPPDPHAGYPERMILTVDQFQDITLVDKGGMYFYKYEF